MNKEAESSIYQQPWAIESLGFSCDLTATVGQVSRLRHESESLQADRSRDCGTIEWATKTCCDSLLHSFQFHGNPEIDKFQSMEKHGTTMKNIQEAMKLCDTSFLAVTNVMHSFGGAKISPFSSITTSSIQFILSLSPPSSVQFYRSLYTVFALKRVLEHAPSRIQPLWNLHSCYPCSSKMRSWSCSCRGVLFRATRSKCTSNPVTSLPFCDEVVIHAVEDHFVRRFIKLQTVQCSKLGEVKGKAKNKFLALQRLFWLQEVSRQSWLSLFHSRVYWTF